MIDFTDFLARGVFKSVDSKFSINFFEKCELKGIKCNLFLTVDFSDFLVMGGFKIRRLQKTKHFSIFRLISIMLERQKLLTKSERKRENENVLGWEPP